MRGKTGQAYRDFARLKLSRLRILTRRVRRWKSTRDIRAVLQQKNPARHGHEKTIWFSSFEAGIGRPASPPDQQARPRLRGLGSGLGVLRVPTFHLWVTAPAALDRSAKKLVTIYIERIDSARAWTNPSHAHSDLADRLKAACPSISLTQRKRLAKHLLRGMPATVVIEEDSAFGSVWHLLESVGAVMSVDRADVLERGLPASVRGAVIRAEEFDGRFRPYLE